MSAVKLGDLCASLRVAPDRSTFHRSFENTVLVIRLLKVTIPVRFVRSTITVFIQL